MDQQSGDMVRRSLVLKSEIDWERYPQTLGVAAT
jgi:hypothetical protein